MLLNTAPQDCLEDRWTQGLSPTFESDALIQCGAELLVPRVDDGAGHSVQ
jgi:hypothetical protein